MARTMSLVRTMTVEVLDEERRLFGQRRVRNRVSSHYELRIPRRGPENRAAVIHMALSMFDGPEIAASRVRRVPKLGGCVATMDLVPGLESASRRPVDQRHWSVWGRSAQLATCVTDLANIGT